jgi:type IV pilus assembly protein PilW
MSGARPAGRIVQYGMSMVELLVAVALGMFVVLGASTMLLASNDGYVRHVEAARLNDNGLYALEIIGRAVRQTGFASWDGSGGPVVVRPEDSASVSGADARSVSRTANGIENLLTASINGSDVLALRFFGAGAGAGGDGSVLNCAGFATGVAGSAAERGWNIFYVAKDTGGEAELRCKYRGETSWGSEAIIRGVDSFQVLYGLDTDQPADGVANRYLNAAAIAQLDGALVLSGTGAAATSEFNSKTWWKRVVSVRVGLLLHGERAGAAGSERLTFDLFGKPYSDLAASTDAGVHIEEGNLPLAQRQLARRMVGATILLRNQAL